MAKQTINTGAAANDGTGDQLRSAFEKINNNFTELYEHDANSSIPSSQGNAGKYLTNNGTETSWSTVSYNNLTDKPTIFNPAAVTQSIIPDTDVAYDLGSATYKFRDLYLSGNTITLGTQTLSSSASGISVSGNIEYTNVVRTPTGFTNYQNGNTTSLNQAYNISTAKLGDYQIGPFLGNSYPSIVYSFPMPSNAATFTFTYDSNRYLETVTMTSAGGNVGNIDDFELIWNPDPTLSVTPVLDTSSQLPTSTPNDIQEIWNSGGKTLYYNYGASGILESITASGWIGSDVVSGYWANRYAGLRLPNGAIADYVLIQEDTFQFLSLNVTYNETVEAIQPANNTNTLQLVAVPTSSVGKTGDKFGMYAYDNTYFYACIKDHDPSNPSENIWKRSPWSGDTW